MIINKKCLAVLLVGMAFLSLGTVIKKKNSIENTQTDPIAYDEKVRQEEEGQKGPPAPTIDLFPKENFLEESPVGNSKGRDDNLDQAAEDSPSWFAEDDPSVQQEEGVKVKDEEADTYSGTP